MARAVFHRPLENPLQLELLPRSRPQMEWPVVTVSPREQTYQALLHLAGLLMAAACAYLLLAFGTRQLFQPSVLLVGVGLYVFLLVSPRYGVPGLFWLYGLALVVFWLLFFRTPRMAAVSGAALLPLLGFLAQRHYASWATASPLDRREAAQFRRRRTLPPGVRPGPFWPAYWQALVVWFTYNRDGCTAPGTFRSPAGCYAFRIMLTFTATIFLSLAVPSLLLRPACRALAVVPLVASLPVLAVIVLAPLLCVLGTILLAGCITFPAAYALAKRRTLPANWRSFNEELRTSRDAIEKESLFLGSVYCDASPVLCPIDILHRHAWLVGSTGSGKTTYLMFLLEQLVARGWSVIYVDLKASDYAPLATLQAARALAPKRRPELAYLANRQGDASHLLCPFTQSWWPRLSSTQKSDVLLAGLGLTFSRSYGESYYSDAAYAVLDFVNHKYPDIQSFRELVDRTSYELVHAKDYELSPTVKRDGEHVRLVLDRLAKCDAFNPHFRHGHAARGAAVDLTKFFTEQCLLYCAFSSLLAPTSSPENARVVVSALVTAATTARRKRPVLLVLDEFQQMVAPGTLQLLLRQSRSLGISVILANQTVDDLKAGTFDLTSTVEGNTSIQAWFKVTDQLGIEQLRRLGGTVVDTLRDESHEDTSNGPVTRVNVRQVLVDRFAANDVAEAASLQDAFILRITDNDGYAQYCAYPFIARSIYHLTKKAYDGRTLTPWPAKTAQTIRVGDTPPAAPSVPPAGPPVPAAGKPISPVITTGLIRPDARTRRRLT